VFHRLLLYELIDNYDVDGHMPESAWYSVLVNVWGIIGDMQYIAQLFGSRHMSDHIMSAKYAEKHLITLKVDRRHVK